MPKLEIRNATDLRTWFRERPATYGAVLAHRTALRTLPVALAYGFGKPSPDRAQVGRLIWVLARSRAGLATLSSAKSANAIRAVQRAAARADKEAERVGNALSLAPRSASIAASKAAQSLWGAASLAEREFEGSDAARYIHDIEQDVERSQALQTAEFFSKVGTTQAATYSASAAADIAGAGGATSVWRALTEDAKVIADTGQFAGLLGAPLWDREPDWFQAEREKVERLLSVPGHPYAIWAEWLSRQNLGEVLSFRFPDRSAEAEFDRRLLGKGETWWSRRDDHVNGDVANWISELSGELAEPTNESLRQNPLALMFRRADDGRIDLAEDVAGPSGNAVSEDIRDLHSEVIREAEAALAASSHTVTQASDLEGPLRDYLAAAGSSFEALRPTLFVLRGNKLRRIFNQRQDEKSLASPLSQDQSDCLESALAAHTLIVGLDENLSAIDQASYGFEPSGQTVTVENMQVFVHEVAAADLATKEAAESLEGAVDVIPAEAPPVERRRKFATESLTNFIRAIGKIVKVGKGVGEVANSSAKAVGWVQANLPLLHRMFGEYGPLRSIIDWIASIKL